MILTPRIIEDVVRGIVCLDGLSPYETDEVFLRCIIRHYPSGYDLDTLLWKCLSGSNGIRIEAMNRVAKEIKNEIN